MEKRNVIIAGVVMLIIAIGGAWAMGYFHRTDPAVAELQQMRQDMFANRDMSEADRRQAWQNMRSKMDNLTDAQRRELQESGRAQMQRFGQQRMDEFFKMSPADQKKRLDDMIDRMVQRQKERQQNPNGVAGGPGGSQGGQNGGQNGQANNGGRGGGGGGGRNLPQAQRDQRSKERIANSDPKSRAQRDIFRQMMDDRMKQRGITPPPGGGGGGRGFPGGGGRV